MAGRHAKKQSTAENIKDFGYGVTNLGIQYYPIVLSVLAVLGLLGGVYFYTQNSKPSSAPTTSSSPTSSQTSSSSAAPTSPSSTSSNRSSSSTSSLSSTSSGSSTSTSSLSTASLSPTNSNSSSITSGTSSATAAAYNGGGSFVYPASTNSIVAAYGKQKINGVLQPFPGINFNTSCGDAVFASSSGTVQQVGSSGGYGNRILVNNGSGVYTTYSHLAGISVKVGDKVSRGQKIAVVGTSAGSTSCQLHFETIKDNKFVEPLNYLNSSPTGDQSTWTIVSLFNGGIKE